MRSRSKEPAIPFDFPELLFWIARVLMYALVLFAPWPYGMVEWRWQVLLVPVACIILLLTACGALIRGMSHPHRLIWPLMAILIVAIVQTLPLPTPFWRGLSQTADFQNQVEVLAAEFAADRENLVENSNTKPDAFSSISPPRSISIHPLQTRATACVFAAGVAILLSASFLFRDRLSLAGLYLSLTVSGFSISLLGLYQTISADDWTLLPNMLGTSFATFIGRNSVPQFLACSLAGASGLLMLYTSYRKKSTSDRRYQIKYPSVNLFAKVRRRIDDFVSDVDVISSLCLLAMIVIAVSILVANSRGGIVAGATSGLITVAVFLLGRKVSTTAIAGLLLLVIASAAFLAFYGLDEAIGRRLDSISEEAYRIDNERLYLWGLVLSQPGCWKLGSGLGTFHFALLPFYDSAQPYWWYHAENIFFELLSNQGIWILLIVLLGVFALLRQLFQATNSKTLTSVARPVCLFAFLAIMLQSLVDFSLILPAVFVPLATIVGAFWGASAKPSSSQNTKRKSAVASRSRSRRKRRQSNRLDSSSSALAAHRKADVSRVERLADTKDGSPSEQVSPSSPTTVNKPLVVQIGIVLVVMAFGFGPLRFFAEGEQLAEISVADVEVDESTQLEFQPGNDDFPETRFQTGRLRQALTEKILRSASVWPAGISDLQRESLSTPELVSAAFRMDSDPELLELKRLVERVPAVIRGIDESSEDMLSALDGCILDWRANWGLLRSEMGRLTDDELDTLYARILITCRSNPAVMQATGTHALIVRHSAAGLRFWREVLPGRVQARASLVGLVGRLITPEQMMEIMPADPWIRLDIAQRFDLAQKQDVAELILQSVEIDPLFLEQSNRVVNWLALAWAAAKTESIDQELEALRQAVLDVPSDIALLVRYVDALARVGKISEAVKEMQQVVSRNPANPTYRQKLDQLQEKQGSMGLPPE